MVEHRNKNLTVVLAKFTSAYTPTTMYDMVAGNAIYSALIAEGHIDGGNNDVKKVSHGIFHEISPGAKDHRGWMVSAKAGKSQVSKIKTYRDFFLLRQYITPYVADGGDNFRLVRSQRMWLENHTPVDVLHPHYITFYIVTDETKFDFVCHEETPSGEVMQHGTTFRLGAHRNLGFGAIEILDFACIEMNAIDFSCFDENEKLIKDAENGMYGVLNHKKYGYGEYQIERWRDKWLVKLTTPMCMRSTIPGSNIFGNIPSHMEDDTYRERIDHIWVKGEVRSLMCVDRGQVFRYKEGDCL